MAINLPEKSLLTNGNHSQLSLKDLNSAMRHEAAGVVTRWYDLGVELLDSNTAVLDVIKTSHQRDDDRCSEMFKTWLEMKPDASWSQLVTALNNIGMKTLAENVWCSKLRDTSIVVKSTHTPAMITTPDQASTEFGILMSKIIMELQQNEDDNLEAIKSICCFLTVSGHDSDTLLFNDDQREAIEACGKIRTLFRDKLRHCWKWNDISSLKMILQSLNESNECLGMLDLYERKIDAQMKLKEIYLHCDEQNQSLPQGYDKMVAIVNNKMFLTITKEEHEKLKRFVSRHCGVKPHVLTPSRVSQYNSVLFEWLIPVTAVSYMVEVAKENINVFTMDGFIFLKISSKVIFDYRNNENECMELLSAAETGDVITVERLLHTRYVDVYTTDPVDKMTSLHYAAERGHVHVVEVLLQLQANVNVTNDDRWTPLHFAAQDNHFQIVKMLIKSEANVNAATKDGWTPLHIAAQNGHLAVVEKLVAMPETDVNIVTKKGWTPFHSAAQNGHTQVVEKLIKSEANINATTTEGWTPARVAAANGHAEVISILLREEADINGSDLDSQTPIHAAALNGHIKVVEMLVKSKVNIDIATKEGWTPIHYAALNGHTQVLEILAKSKARIDLKTQEGWIPLHYAALNGHAKVVEALINLNSQLNINDATKEGWTALYASAQSGHTKVVEVLIQSGANVNAVAKEGWTPLHVAAQNGHTRVVEVLIKSEANIHGVSENGWTPLHCASLYAHVKVAERLTEAGQNIDTFDHAGDAPLHIASRRGNLGVVEVLITAGADAYITNKFNRLPIEEAIRCEQYHIVKFFVKDVKMDITLLDQATQVQIRRISKQYFRRSLGDLIADYDPDQSSDAHSSASSDHESSDTESFVEG